MRSSWFSEPLINSTRDLLHQLANYVGDYWSLNIFTFETGSPKVRVNSTAAEIAFSDFQRIRIKTSSRMILAARMLCEEIISKENGLAFAKRIDEKERSAFISLLILCEKTAANVVTTIDSQDVNLLKKNRVRMASVNQIISLLAVSLAEMTCSVEPHPFDHLVIEHVIPNSELCKTWLSSRKLDDIVDSARSLVA